MTTCMGTRVCAHTHACVHGSPPTARGAEWNPEPTQNFRRIVEERASLLLGCKYLGFQRRWESREQRRSVAESLGVAKTRITMTCHFSVAPFFEVCRRPCGWDSLEPSVPGNGAPGFWTSASFSEHY